MNHEYVCEWCNKSFTIPERIKSKRFCSQNCKRLFVNKKVSESIQKRIREGTFVSPFSRKHYGKRKAKGDWKCCYCNNIFRTKQELYQHKKEIHPHKKPWNKGLTINSNEVIRKTIENLRQRYASGELIASFKGKKHSEETKQKLSKIRKEWIKNNPDKQPWKRKDKFKSVPCEKLKTILKKDFIFCEEYTDTRWEHNYSLDIAFLDKKLAIEVNGTQHYAKDGNLKPYYQTRHDYLESQGWIVIELHYANCYNLENIQKIKDAIINRKQIPDDEHKLLWQNKNKSKEEKELEKKLRYKKAKIEGKIASNNRINYSKNTYAEWFDRKEKILTSGIDLTKFGWVGKVIEKTGLTKRKLENTIKHFKDEFEGKYFKRNYNPLNRKNHLPSN